ncbi:54S ribosomal protein L8, mitochondrial [Cryptotrichosporon argae]
MKHGLKLRKLQRTSSHRQALLRNLVSALLHHEMIKTTVPKAKEAARLAEKIITLSKKGTDPARRAAQAFLFPSHHYAPSSSSHGAVAPPLPLGYPSSSSSSSSSSSLSPSADPESFEPPTTLLPKLLTTLATRYASRPGGYTRVHRFGRRPGDNAPVALLCLVDGPRDVAYEMAARARGIERAQAGSVAPANVTRAEAERRDEAGARARLRTDRVVEKVLKYRSDEDRAAFEKRAEEHAQLLVAEGKAIGQRRPAPTDGLANFRKPTQVGVPTLGRATRAGDRLPGMSVAHTGLGLARGVLGRAGVRAVPRFLGEHAAAADEARA